MRTVSLRVGRKWPLWLLITLFVLCGSGAIFALSGKPQDDKPLNLVVLHQASTCGAISESQWLSDQKQYENAFNALFQGVISNTRPQPEAIDFARYGVLLISMGQQRSGGYSVKLSSDRMEVVDNHAKIHLQWVTKKPGMITIQMLTNPCLLLKVPKAGYDAIDVIDQSNITRLSVPVN